jgi:hypothetical protein
MTKDEEWWKRSKRPGFGPHTFGDKQYAECDVTRDALLAAGFDLGDDLRSIPKNEDPPDCEALVDGVLCGIEVRELLHQEALEQSVRARAAIKRSEEPRNPEVFCYWERDDMLTELQRIITRKDKPKFKVPRSYQRYFLVIYTIEMVLVRDIVTEYLKDATFQAEFITDVLFLLDYHPDPEEQGSRPVFVLLRR